jgi:hypothetical protein
MENVTGTSWRGSVITFFVLALAASVLLFLAASANLVLTRDDGRVEANVSRVVLFGWLTVERQEVSDITSISVIDYHKFGQVALESKRGTFELARLSVHRPAASQLVESAKRFLADKERHSVTLPLPAPTGATKTFGVILLAFVIVVLGNVAGSVGLKFLRGFLGGAGLFAVPALALLWMSASTTLELQRTGAYKRTLRGATCGSFATAHVCPPTSPFARGHP